MREFLTNRHELWNFIAGICDPKTQEEDLIIKWVDLKVGGFIGQRRELSHPFEEERCMPNLLLNEQLEEIRKDPKKGEWLKTFKPTDEFRNEVQCILDWLKAMILDNKTLEIDDLNRITYSQALKEAKEYRRNFPKENLETAEKKPIKKRPSRMEISPDSERVVPLKLGRGFTICEILQPEGLLREGVLMGNCLKEGNDALEYSERLKGGTHRYFSLRDKKNKPHVTFEVEGVTVTQCEGKGGKVAPKYIPFVQEFVRKRGLSIRHNHNNVGLVKVDGKYYDIFKLPEGFRYKGALDISGLSGVVLPGNLDVGGIDLSDTDIAELPEGFKSRGDVIWRNSKVQVSLPGVLKIKWGLFIDGTKTTGLFPPFKARMSVLLEGSKITGLSKGSEAGLSLSVRTTDIAELPRGLKVANDSTWLDDVWKQEFQIEGNLDLRGTDIATMPERIEVKGNILSNLNSKCPACKAKVPTVFMYKPSLNLNGSQVTELPENFRRENPNCRVIGLPIKSKESKDRRERSLAPTRIIE